MSENKEDEGIHFDPTEKELIQTYLIPKLRGEPCEDEFIEMKDVYAKEPWLLDHTNDPFFQKNQWYYFVKRTQVSEKKIGCGKYTKRRITGDNNDGIDRGSWTATKKDNIIDEQTREIIGVRQSLTFSKSDHNNKKQKRRDGTCATVPGSESSWIMKEFTLPPKEDEFQNLALCRIEEIKHSNKDDHHQEASTSNYNHHLDHEFVQASYSEHQPINDHESVLASSSEQQPINDHDYALASYSEYQPINDHVLASYSEYQSINDHDYVLPSYVEHQPINNHGSSYSEQQPINDHESVLASYSEYQPINDLEYVLPSYLEHQPINNYESVLASYSKQQPPINGHESVLASYLEHQPPINGHDEYVLPSYSVQQPLNETFHHYPEFPHIGTEKINDQVMKSSSLIDDEAAKLNERTREHNALERSETLGSEEDNQVPINAPLACFGHNSSLVTGSEQEAGETEDWLQELVNSLLAQNGPDVPVEEDQDWLLDVPHEETEESERLRF